MQQVKNSFFRLGLLRVLKLAIAKFSVAIHTFSNTYFSITYAKVSKSIGYAKQLGIQIRNMKRGFNIYGTWRWVTFEKLVMKIYVFFYSAKSFSHPV